MKKNSGFNRRIQHSHQKEGPGDVARTQLVERRNHKFLHAGQKPLDFYFYNIIVTNALILSPEKSK